MRLLLLMALCVGNAWAGDTVIKETDDYGNEKPGKIVVKEDGKIYRVDGYGHRAEAGYLQMKEDGKTVKEVDGYGHEKPGVSNASVEFNLQTLAPTYRLMVGLPGRSNALAIAQRLGMPGPIIQSARADLNPTDVRAEDLLDEIFLSFCIGK